MLISIETFTHLLGVFGSLDLYGMPHNVYHTKLASTSQAGNSTISLQESVDWKVRSFLKMTKNRTHKFRKLLKLLVLFAYMPFRFQDLFVPESSLFE